MHIFSDPFFPPGGQPCPFAICSVQRRYSQTQCPGSIIPDFIKDVGQLTTWRKDPSLSLVFFLFVSSFYTIIKIADVKFCLNMFISSARVQHYSSYINK